MNTHAHMCTNVHMHLKKNTKKPHGNFLPGRRLLAALLAVILTLTSTKLTAYAESGIGKDPNEDVEWLTIREILGIPYGGRDDDEAIRERNRQHVREWLETKAAENPVDAWKLTRTFVSKIELLEGAANRGGSSAGARFDLSWLQIRDAYTCSCGYPFPCSPLFVSYASGGKARCPKCGNETRIRCELGYLTTPPADGIYICFRCAQTIPSMLCNHNGKTNNGVPRWDYNLNRAHCTNCSTQIFCAHELTDWAIFDYYSTYNLQNGNATEWNHVAKTCRYCGYVAEICEHESVTCIAQGEDGTPLYQCNNCGFTSEVNSPYITIRCSQRDFHTQNYMYVCDECGYQGSTVAAESCPHKGYMHPTWGLWVTYHEWDYDRKLWVCTICGFTATCADNGHMWQFGGTESAVFEDSEYGGALACGLCGEVMGGGTGGGNEDSSIHELTPFESNLITLIEAQHGSVVEETLGLDTTLSSEVLSAIKENEATLNLHVGSEFTWTVSGSAADTAQDMNLRVEHADTPVESFLHLPETYVHTDVKSLSLTDADFGEGAALTMNICDMYAGQFANIYKTDPNTDAPVFMGVSVIEDDGSVAIFADESAVYTVIIDTDTKLPGDIDNSMSVSETDAWVLAGQISGTVTCGYLCKSDVNGDGMVNVRDVSAVLRLAKSEK